MSCTFRTRGDGGDLTSTQRRPGRWGSSTNRSQQREKAEGFTKCLLQRQCDPPFPRHRALLLLSSSRAGLTHMQQHPLTQPHAAPHGHADMANDPWAGDHSPSSQGPHRLGEEGRTVLWGAAPCPELPVSGSARGLSPGQACCCLRSCSGTVPRPRGLVPNS